MQSPAPDELEQISQLFEKNTIRQTPESGSSRQRLDLALPEPLDAPGGFPMRTQTAPRSERSVMMPFASATPEQKAATPASTRVAHLNRLLEINPEPLVSPQRANSQPAAAPLRSDQQAEFASQAQREQRLQQDAEASELRLQIKCKDLQLEMARVLQLSALPLAERLESLLKQWLLDFNLWGARLQLSATGHPLQQSYLELVVSPRLKNWKQQTLPARQNLRHQACSAYQELMIRLQIQGQDLGQLSLAYAPSQTFSAESEQNLNVLASDLSRFLQAEAAFQWALSESICDPLTGLLNYSAFYRQLEAQWAAGSKTNPQKSAAVLLIDLDFLTQINEVHGVEQGDSVLQHLTRILLLKLPEQAVLGRLGNDLFAVALSQMSLIEAADWGEKMRQAIAKQPLSGKFESPLDLTVSLGLAHQDPLASVPLILQQATEALSRAKDRGRNQLQIFRAESSRQIPVSGSSQPMAKPIAKTIAKTQPTAAPTRAAFQLDKGQVRSAYGPVQALQWSEILKNQRAELETEWLQQTADYGVDTVSHAVQTMQERLGRLLDSLCTLLDQKSNLAELDKMPLSYFMPSVVVAAIRRGDKAYQLNAYEVAFMLLQESMEKILPTSTELETAMDGFFHCVNSKLTGLKSSVDGK